MNPAQAAAAARADYTQNGAAYNSGGTPMLGVTPSTYSYVPDGSGGYNFFMNGSTPITREQYAAGSGNPYPVNGQAPQVAGDQTSNLGATGGASAQTAAQAQMHNQLMGQLGYAQGLVGQLNNLYGSIYGQGGAFDTGLQNSRNSIESGYVPQYQNVGLQANQMAQGLDWQNIANGTGVSSIAGQQQQNLAGQAGNEAAAISAQKDKDLNDLASKSQAQKAQDLADQAQMNTQLGLFNQQIPSDTTGAGLYRLGGFATDLAQNVGKLSGYQAGNQPSGQLGAALNAAAPSQIFSPQVLQQTLHSINQSTLPNYLQGVLQQGVVNSNTQNPGDYNYWTNYVKNLANPIST